MKRRKARRRPLKQEPTGLTAIAQQGFGFEMPPDPDLVGIYFDQQSAPEEAINFFSFYDGQQWRTTRGHPVRNWKVAAADWLFEWRQARKLKLKLSVYSFNG